MQGADCVLCLQYVHNIISVKNIEFSSSFSSSTT